MKPISLTTLLILCLFSSFAQKQNDPLSQPYLVEKDTMYAMVDYQGKIQNLPGMPFVRKYWPEDGRYRELLFDTEKSLLVRAAWYKDRDCKEKQGIWEEYHPNGMTKDSGRYENNLKQGIFRGWYENGDQHHVFHYDKGIPIDTGYVFRDDGSLAQLSITDNNGNGIEQTYFENGKVKLLGKLNEGKRNGTWTLKREDGSKLMFIEYMMDSVAQTSCFEKDGTTPVKGDCVFERPAEFPGGVSGWQTFLMKNMRYPNIAIDKNIQGVVRVQFIVSNDGNVSEFSILSSPDKSLSEEVLRFMKKSPKWLPAIQYNQPVTYRHIQAVSFRLE